MRDNETRTATRIYYTTSSANGLWRAHFQPLNPKTGHPWQAARDITKSWDAYVLWNHQTVVSSGIIFGRMPKDWSQNGVYTSGSSGYSTEALALAAIAEEKRKSGK